ncbi:MAG: PqqD family protein [Clostridium sp.]|nr:PqqD family protein [Clostridium sp.]MCI7444163.1 PqqD family protein [Clostridium sp.]
MKIKDGFVVREILDSYMAVPVGERTRDVHGVIALNETGAFLWKMLEEDTSEDKLIASMVKEYEITEETAKDDIKEYLSFLREKGWLYD